MLDLIKGERTSSEAGVLRTARLNWLLDGYINLLADYAKDGDLTAMDEAFRMADLARGSTVQRALAASASRANVTIRRWPISLEEQDLQREISCWRNPSATCSPRSYQRARQDRRRHARQLNTLRANHKGSG
jgi:hypothetical protein